MLTDMACELQKRPREQASHACGVECGAGRCVAQRRWFAVRTKSRQEKAAAAVLESLAFDAFLPLKTEVRQWSDRRQAVRVPLFGGYLFVQTNLMGDNKLRVLQVPGVAGFVIDSRGPAPIPDEQVEAVRAVVSKGMDCTVQPLLEHGDRVRVMRGALAGIEGRLLRGNSSSRLVISIGSIHQSIAVTIARADVELLEAAA